MEIFKSKKNVFRSIKNLDIYAILNTVYDYKNTWIIPDIDYASMFSTLVYVMLTSVL